jgi:hypothetical protein
MPRPRIDLDLIRAHIISWTQAHHTTEEIAQNIETTFGWTVSERTIYRRLESWGIRRRVTAEDTPNLRAQIAILFRMSCTDDEIVIELQYCRYNINKTQVTRLRREMGLLRRLSVFEREERDTQLFEILREELDNGRIEGYGRRLLRDYFQKNGQLVARYRLLLFSVSFFVSFL